jgi:hypothetical protein
MIQNALKEKKGLLIGRHGTLEFQAVLNHFFNKDKLSSNESLQAHAGIFPTDSATVNEWVSDYWKSTLVADCMASGWYAPTSEIEDAFIKDINPEIELVVLRSLEPYYASINLRWTSLLNNHRVTVVSSFTETMKQQLGKRSEIWGVNADSILPQGTKWSFVRTYYPPALTNKSTAWKHSSWKDAVEGTFQNIVATNPHIVLLGCGGLAMILAAKLKKHGIIAIVLGGAIQVLFGIKGQRWAKHDVISKFWNDSWVYPSQEETPDHSKYIENSCYWGSDSFLTKSTGER